MMDYNLKIHYIPARPKPIERVGIYCRVYHPRMNN